jgi:hypothetical protein
MEVYIDINYLNLMKHRDGSTASFLNNKKQQNRPSEWKVENCRLSVPKRIGNKIKNAPG